MDEASAVVVASLPLAAGRRWVWAAVGVTLGTPLAAIGLAPAASASPTRALSWLLFVAASVHVASTGWLFSLADVRRRAARRPGRFIWAPFGLVVSAAFVAAATAPATMRWIVLLFFAWQFWHFQKQNVGMVALAASAYGVVSPRPAERRAVMVAGAAGIVGLLARPGLLQLPLRSPIGALFVPALVVFAAAVGWGVAALARRPAPERPLGFVATLTSSLVFVAPIFAFGAPYAAVGGMTIAHGGQYLLLLAAMAWSGDPGVARAWRVGVLVNGALVGRRRAGGGVAPARRRVRDTRPVRRVPRGRDGALRGRRRALAPARPGGTRRAGGAAALPGGASVPSRRGLGPRPTLGPMTPTRRRADPSAAPDDQLVGFGRYAGPATLILASLAEGPRHGYALTKDIETFAGVRLAPGTLYEALGRLEGRGLIEALASEDRRRPYRLTAVGAAALRAHLQAQRRVADLGLRRLSGGWGTA